MRSRLERETPFVDAFPRPLALVRGPDEEIVLANSAFLKLAARPGGRRDATVRLADVLPSLAFDGRIAATAHVRATRRALTIRAHSIDDGSGLATRWDIEIAPMPAFGPDHLLVLATDVTARLAAEREAERWAAEARLRLDRAVEAERTLSAVLRFIPEGLVVVEGPEGLVTHVSEYCAEVLGRSADELAGRPLDEAVARWHVVDRTGARLAAGTDLPIARALARGEIVRDERVEVERGDGRRVVMSCSAAPIRDPAGRITGALATWRDVTEIEATRRSLAESEARLGLAFRAAGMGPWELDLASGRLQAGGPAAGDLGVAAPGSREEPRGEPDAFVARFHPQDQARVRRDLAALRAGRQTLRAAYRVMRSDGGVRWLRLSGRRMPGEGQRVIGVALDATEEKQREQALQDALVEKERLLRQKDVLLKEVNHRVKNSLQMISSLLSLQANGLKDPATRAVFAEARARVTTVARVHQRLYQTDDVAHVELSDYLRDLAANLAESIRPGDVRVEVVAPRVEVATDRAIPLALIVNELVTNAAKYAYPEGTSGTVRVEVTPQAEDGLVVIVADAGVGLPEDFDPARSNGLGMRLVRALVDKIDGRLEMAGGHPGAVFTIHVPPDRAGS
jgi:PAS domain S-box-containing protein